MHVKNQDSRRPVEPISVVAPPLTEPVVMSQQWRDLTFVHWAVAPADVAHLMPAGIVPDTLGGVTYVGLVPFRMVGAGFGRGPAVPWAGTFLETNVRLYSVDRCGRRGIVFLSLDADRSVVVAGARAALGLPYRWARMRYARSPGLHGTVHVYDARLRRPGSRARSHVAVEVGEPREPSLLDHFLTARWGLHVRRFGRTLYVPNEHPPWALHTARVLALDDELLRSVGLGDLGEREPDHVTFSPGVPARFGLPVDALSPRRSRLVDTDESA